jgi:pimeloyl-ACP methyl ester carboxylesterase
MASLLLVHGAGSSPSVFAEWPASFPGMHVVAVDLQAGLDPAQASMGDYAENIVRAAADAEAPVSVVGWSMGGLVAMMAAQRVAFEALVLLEPSAPAEVQGLHPDSPFSDGTYDPEEAYGGPFPESWGARPESRLARDERKRGVSIPALPRRSLVVYGHDFAEERGKAVAGYYGCAERGFPEYDHGELVSRPEVRQAIAQFLATPMHIPTG